MRVARLAPVVPIMLVVVSGCGSQDEPVASGLPDDVACPDHAASAEEGHRSQDANERLAAAVADRFPEFGGHFLSNNEQTLNIWMIEPADDHRAECVRDALVEHHNDPTLAAAELKVLPATYGWHDLTEWNLRLRQGSPRTVSPHTASCRA
jgi:type IV pilus biogenesis protein CpaD/CtpE